MSKRGSLLWLKEIQAEMKRVERTWLLIRLVQHHFVAGAARTSNLHDTKQPFHDSLSLVDLLAPRRGGAAQSRKAEGHEDNAGRALEIPRRLSRHGFRRRMAYASRASSRLPPCRYPERACFTVYEPERRSLNYREALAKIEAAARKLRSLGIGKGDKVAVTRQEQPRVGGRLFRRALRRRRRRAHRLPAQRPRDGQPGHGRRRRRPLRRRGEGGRARRRLPRPQGRLLPRGGQEGQRPRSGRVPMPRGGSSLDAPAEGELAAILFTSGTMGTPEGRHAHATATSSRIASWPRPT